MMIYMTAVGCHFVKLCMHPLRSGDIPNVSVDVNGPVDDVSRSRVEAEDREQGGTYDRLYIDCVMPESTIVTLTP